MSCAGARACCGPLFAALSATIGAVAGFGSGGSRRAMILDGSDAAADVVGYWIVTVSPLRMVRGCIRVLAGRVLAGKAVAGSFTGSLAGGGGASRLVRESAPVSGAACATGLAAGCAAGPVCGCAAGPVRGCSSGCGAPLAGSRSPDGGPRGGGGPKAETRCGAAAAVLAGGGDVRLILCGEVCSGGGAVAALAGAANVAGAGTAAAASES